MAVIIFIMNYEYITLHYLYEKLLIKFEICYK